MRRVFQITFTTVITLASLLQGNISALASDWEEEKPPNIEQAITNPDSLDNSSNSSQERFAEPDFPSNNNSSHNHSSNIHAGSSRLEGGVNRYKVLPDQTGALSGSAMDSFSQAPPNLYPNGVATGIFDRSAFIQQNIQSLIPMRPVSTPPSTFRSWLENNYSQFALSTNTMSKDLVLEVKGAWDDSGKTIRALGIPHTTIKAGKLTNYPLDTARLLVINCAGEVPRESLQLIRDFVAHGGFLLTTDWALDGVLRRAFPGYVEWNNGQTSGEVVDAVVTDPDSPLTQNLVRRAGWKLDEGSQILRVLKPQTVHVLARSVRLMRNGQDPDGQGVLAVWFPFGRGQVLHLVGHFDNNSNLAFVNMLPDPAPGMGISLRQALATNFMVAALSRQITSTSPASASPASVPVAAPSN